MELLPILRTIWRRRLLLCAGVLGAVAVFVGLGGTNSASTSSAIAWTGVVLDTPKSQLVDVAPAGADTLPWRASLLTHLLGTNASVRDLARRTGIKADQLNVVDSALTQPLVTTAMAQAAATAASLTSAPYVLTVFNPNESLPMISIEAAAPKLGDAKRLAQAAVAALESQASPGGSFDSPIATNAKVFKLQPFVVSQAAPIKVKLVAASAMPAKAIGASFFLFLAWCTGVCLLPVLSRRLRRRTGALLA